MFLKKGTYPDLTTAAANDNFTLEEDYHPIVFTLKQNGDAKVTDGTLADVVTCLQSISKNYAPNTNLSTLLGTYTLSWKWAFEGNDQADTLLGNLAAGTVSDIGVDPMTHYSTHIAFHLVATITQID